MQIIIIADLRNACSIGSTGCCSPHQNIAAAAPTCHRPRLCSLLSADPNCTCTCPSASTSIVSPLYSYDCQHHTATTSPPHLLLSTTSHPSQHGILRCTCVIVSSFSPEDKLFDIIPCNCRQPASVVIVEETGNCCGPAPATLGMGIANEGPRITLASRTLLA